MAEIYAYPATCIMHNLPYKRVGVNRVIGKSFNCVRDELVGLGYPVRKIYTVWHPHNGNFMRATTIEFERCDDKYRSAFKLQKSFERVGKGKSDYEGSFDSTFGPHLWFGTSTDSDLMMKSKIFITVPDNLNYQGYNDADKDSTSAYVCVMNLLKRHCPCFYM